MKQILFFILFLPSLIHSQSARLNYADKQFKKKAFYEAAEAYEDVLDRTGDSLTVGRRIAESYIRYGNLEKASAWFDFLERNNILNKNQHLELALIKRKLGQYDDSENLFRSYAARYGSSDITEEMLNPTNDLEALQKEDPNFILSNQTINSESSEIGVTYYRDNEVILTSSERKNLIVSREDKSTGQNYYSLYKGFLDEQGNILNKRLLKGQVNSKFHDGPACYDSVNNYLYFTRNNSTDIGEEHEQIRLKIYRAKLVDEKFEDIEELSFNNNSYSCGYPTISKDGKTLFFISDMPGGFGGTDIYKAKMNENNEFLQPENLGDKINTSLNEFSPYLHPEEDILFFSSNGHFGLGGLDVFVTRLSGDEEVGLIKNLGAPINSRNDDFSFVNNSTQKFGFFASNRDGGEGLDDIYGFIQKKPIVGSPVVRGIISHTEEGKNLEEVEITVKDLEGNIISTETTDSEGNYSITIGDHQGDFVVTAQKDGFIINEEKIEYISDKQEYKEDFSLTEYEPINYRFIGTIRDARTLKPLQGVTVTVDDLKKEEQVAQMNTNELGQIKAENLPFKTNQVIEIKAKLEKPGYITKSEKVEIQLDENKDIDLSDKMKINMTKIEVGVTDLTDVANLNTIYFDLNSSYIREDAAVELDKIVEVMKDNPQMIVELGSHTDSRGEQKYNIWLSDRRAKRSADYIISKGIDESRISGKGYGHSKPIFTNEEIAKAKTEEAKEALHQKNRRTEFIVVEMR